MPTSLAMAVLEDSGAPQMAETNSSVSMAAVFVVVAAAAAAVAVGGCCLCRCWCFPRRRRGPGRRSLSQLGSRPIPGSPFRHSATTNHDSNNGLPRASFDAGGANSGQAPVSGFTAPGCPVRQESPCARAEAGCPEEGRGRRQRGAREGGCGLAWAVSLR